MTTSPERTPAHDDPVASFVAMYANDSTRRSYEADMRSFGQWCWGQGLRLFEVGRAEVIGFMRHLEELGRASSTTARTLSVVSSFYRWAIREGFTQINPVDGIRRPRAPRQSSTVGLTKVEAQALLEASARAGTRDHLICCLLVYNGLRVSAATGARIENLGRDRGHHVLRIRQKGGAEDWVALADPTWRAIAAHLEERGWPTVGPLIGRKRGETRRAIHRLTIQRVLNELGEQAGIATHLHPHALRHTFVTMALEAGVPLHHVQDAAGHSNPATTQRYNRARYSLDRHATYRLADYLEE